MACGQHVVKGYDMVRPEAEDVLGKGKNLD